MSLFFISDVHFSHTNLLRPDYDNRPFNDTEDMNESLISNWNESITKYDTVINLGDYGMGRVNTIAPILSRLNYREMILVKGNHEDKRKVKIYESFPGIKVVENYNLNYRVHTDSGIVFFRFWCSHKPTDEYFDQVDWHDSPRVIPDYCTVYDVRLYGHVHSSAPRGLQYDYRGKLSHEPNAQDTYLPGFSYHVGVDTNDYKPVPIDRICQEILEHPESM